jgi:hypothetical protein
MYLHGQISCPATLFVRVFQIARPAELAADAGQIKSMLCNSFHPGLYFRRPQPDHLPGLPSSPLSDEVSIQIILKVFQVGARFHTFSYRVLSEICMGERP